MEDLKVSSSIPEIKEDKVFYKWTEYQLIRISEDWVKKTGTPLEIAKWWLLKIEGDKIWCYWIPEQYLSYTLINEIECPEVKSWQWLCLEWLKKELIQVPAVIVNEYLAWRLQFFQNMEKFYQLEDFLDDPYAAEMKECHEYLDWEIERRNIISEISWMVWNTMT
jgi:hypothetical protein